VVVLVTAAVWASSASAQAPSPASTPAERTGLQHELTLAGFERACRAEGGEYVPSSTFYGVVPVPVAAGCGFGRAKDAYRLCSTAEHPEAGDTCNVCQYPPSCGPAAGDFGPMLCHCGTFSRLTRFGVTRGTIELQPAVVLFGEFDAEVLQAYVRGRRNSLLQCYERSLKKNPSLRGRVELVFTILLAGRSSAIEAKADGFSTSNSSDEVTTCLKTVVRGWVLPRKTEAPVTLKLPMVFSPVD